ncbi:MAG: PH domain-containing protein [Actinobacteria bacterium]|nr:MAG: PH domain-containing protein [Actinomycetota bacterium]
MAGRSIDAVPFPRRLLTEGEEIILDLRPHWVALLKPVLWTIVIGSLTGLIWVKTGGQTSVRHVLQWVVVGVAFVLWVPLALAPAIRWRFTTFVLTNERVITRSGVVAKHAREIPLETVNDVTFRQGILERMIGAGSLIIESAGEHGQDAFAEVRKPEHVQLEIYRASEARKGLGRPGGHSLADELAKLAELRDKGVLTDEEFQARKRKLLES